MRPVRVEVTDGAGTAAWARSGAVMLQFAGADVSSRVSWFNPEGYEIVGDLRGAVARGRLDAVGTARRGGTAGLGFSSNCDMSLWRR
jgi:hypothetical protein